MNAPLTSLDPVDWLVWSDWCGDHDRVKAEKFARKTAIALQKMLAVGCDPSMRLAVRCRTIPDFDGVAFCCKKDDVAGFIKEVWAKNWKHASGVEYRPMRGWFIWMTDRMTGRKHFDCRCCDRLLPADLAPFWKDERVYWKFFRMLQRRATGIPNSVLEAVDEGDRV